MLVRIKDGLSPSSLPVSAEFRLLFTLHLFRQLVQTLIQSSCPEDLALQQNFTIATLPSQAKEIFSPPSPHPPPPDLPKWLVNTQKFLQKCPNIEMTNFRRAVIMNQCGVASRFKKEKKRILLWKLILGASCCFHAIFWKMSLLCLALNCRGGLGVKKWKRGCFLSKIIQPAFHCLWNNWSYQFII